MLKVNLFVIFGTSYLLLLLGGNV